MSCHFCNRKPITVISNGREVFSAKTRNSQGSLTDPTLWGIVKANALWASHHQLSISSVGHLVVLRLIFKIRLISRARLVGHPSHSACQHNKEVCKNHTYTSIRIIILALLKHVLQAKRLHTMENMLVAIFSILHFDAAFIDMNITCNFSFNTGTEVMKSLFFFI